jgi:dTDP-glucose 4,6-dehydratase
MTHVPETHLGGPDPLLASSAYGEGKRISEWLASQAIAKGLEIKIARVFALVGPHLPLNKHFAIGNFLQNAMAGEQIIIQGDGTPYRSYLYAADMAAWLWAVLIRGQPGRAYNVGSEESLSIRSLAERICGLLDCAHGVAALQNAQPGLAPAHYVPDTARARHELHLPPAMVLDEAITRTVH